MIVKQGFVVLWWW